MLPDRIERGERLQRVARTAFIVHAQTFVVTNIVLFVLFSVIPGIPGFVFPIVLASWGLALMLHAIATFYRPSHD